jgi:hypothetical protein
LDATLGNFAAHLFGGGVVIIRDNERHAGTPETMRDRPADAVSTTGDHGH